MHIILSILSFIFVFSLAVIAHELGHLIWAKRAGIRVFEFGIGIGPKLFRFKWKDTIYGLNLFPIGGFVRIAGVEEEFLGKDEDCPEDQKFSNKTTLQRFKAIFAGPAMNIVLAVVIYFFIFTALGVPSAVTNEISSIVPGSPAEQAGFQRGDKIVALNQQKIEKMEDAIKIIHSSGGKALVVTLQRGDERITKKVTPKFDEKQKMAFLGFSPGVLYERYNPLQSAWMAIEQAGKMVGVMFFMLWLIFSGSVSLGDLAGPVGIAQISGTVAASGFYSLLYFTAFLSINLAIVNLLPIPALDGGRLFFIIIEAIRGKPVDPKLENRIHYAGFMLLLGLLLILTINDILRLFRF